MSRPLGLNAASIKTWQWLRYRVGVLRVLTVACAVLVASGCSVEGEAGDVLTPTATSPAPTPPATPTSSPPACDDEPCYGEIVNLGQLDSEVVAEVSGMAASRRTPGLFYVVSDHAGTSEIAVVKEDGTLAGRIEVDGMSARNAEDLAVGPCGPDAESTCLFIGDIGNHVGLADLFVYRIPEPDLTDLPVRVSADQLRYTYPGEPTDAEALLVDDAGHPLIISKARFDEATGDTGPTQLFRGSRDGGTLEHLADLELPEPEAPFFADLVGHVVTAADSVPGRVILRTYDEIYEYRAEDPDTDLGTFPDWSVRRVPTPFQMQSETIAYQVGGCGFLATSELTGSIDGVGCE